MAVGFVEKRPERPPVERLLWRLRKGERTADAHLREMPGHGVELRFSVRGVLMESRMARDREALEPVAAEKLAAFVALGWTAVPVHCQD